MNDHDLARVREEIAALENALAAKKRQLEAAEAASCAGAQINNRSPPEAKIALFHALFRGREDVYAKRFESKKTGNAGYQPVCRNEWAAGVCEKPRTKCGNCGRRRWSVRVRGTALAAHNSGILSASTAFGKTVVALWMIAHRKVTTLILVHRTQLLDQWVERITQFLGIPKKDIGCFSGGKKRRTGIIDIAVMQSLVKKDIVEEWITEYGQIIVDECHHISAASFERIIRKCPAYYRLGLSATLVRRDAQYAHLPGHSRGAYGGEGVSRVKRAHRTSCCVSRNA